MYDLKGAISGQFSNSFPQAWSLRQQKSWAKGTCVLTLNLVAPPLQCWHGQATLCWWCAYVPLLLHQAAHVAFPRVPAP